MQLTDIPLKKEKSFNTWAGVFLVIVTALGTGYMSEFSIPEAIKVIPGILGFIFTDFLPPNAKAVPNIISPLLDTFYMAVIATGTAGIISLVLALLSAAPTAPNLMFKVTIRAVASLLRNIPALGWAMILIPAFGIGKFVGLLALTISSIGTMTRFFTETIEEIDVGKIEAIRATGGSYWQTLKNGVLPQCTPGLVAWTLYNLEVDIRASTIIGMVGGGGVGLFIQSSLKLFRYDHATMAILLVAILVLVVEFISKKVRERIM
jgi:phosphonate transport system permease protein